MAAISCDGEVGDGAEVAAAEALGGFGEGGVGLDAERVAVGAGVAVTFGGSGLRHGRVVMVTVLLPMVSLLLGRWRRQAGSAVAGR